MTKNNRADPLVNHGPAILYWPTRSPVTASLTPSQAWRAWLAGKIDAEEFGRIIDAWSA
jgi:hypothetical protein